MCSIQSQYKGNHKGGRAAEGRAATFVVAAEGRPFVLALNRAHVLAVSTTHVLRVSNVEVLVLNLNTAHVLCLNNAYRSSLACWSVGRSIDLPLARSLPH